MERGRLWRMAFGGYGQLLERDSAGLTGFRAFQRPTSGAIPASCRVGHIGFIRRLHGRSGAI